MAYVLWQMKLRERSHFRTRLAVWRADQPDIKKLINVELQGIQYLALKNLSEVNSRIAIEQVAVVRAPGKSPLYTYDEGSAGIRV